MKITKLFFLISILFCVACQSEKKQEEIADTVMEEVDTTISQASTSASQQQAVITNASNPNSILVTCDAVGKISIGDSYADVVRKAGKENVTSDSVFVAGKFYDTFCTKVWKGTAGEITINWQESKQPYQIIQNIIIDNFNSTYVLENGIKIGTKLMVVNKLNGKSFEMYGLEGSNKGLLTSYQGGNLATQIPCVRLVFKNPNPKAKGVPDLAYVDGIIPSALPALQKIDPIVIKLIINSKR